MGPETSPEPGWEPPFTQREDEYLAQMGDEPEWTCFEVATVWALVQISFKRGRILGVFILSIAYFVFLSSQLITVIGNVWMERPLFE